MRSTSLLLAALLGVAAPGCASDPPDPSDPSDPDPDPQPTEETRASAMGFSPWQYDATLEARDWVYERLAAEGDIISHHLEEGVPWPEMLAGEDLPGTFKAELADRRDRRVPGQKVLVQINPMDISRTGLAAYRGSSPVMPLPAPWDTYTFETPEVHQAFLTYARRIVDELQPDYLLIGVEVNLLIRSNPALWPGYAALHQEVYAALKAERPDLPIGVSVFCVPYFPEYSGEDDLDAQLAGLADLEPHVDTVAFSLHPFMSALLADTFPDDYFDRLFALTQKPVAISESSYPAQEFTIPEPPTAGALAFHGSQEKQDHFLQRMIAASEARRAEYIIWFTVRDYDALWSGLLDKSDLALVWRDTGLYGEAGDERLALGTWRAHFGRTLAP